MRQMKDSGIEWIGQIPQEWEVRKNKYVMQKQKDICECYNGENILSLSMLGVHIRDLDAGGKMPTTFDGYQYVVPGDLLLCLFDIDVTPRCVGLVKDYGITSPAYSRFETFKGFCNKYYEWLLLYIDNSKIYVHLSKNLRNSLMEEDYGSIFTLVPPLPEQQAIADKLDKVCGEIDNVITKTKSVVEEYKKLKQAIITEAVTHGVRGQRPMKDSGIEWIGQIPQEWEVTKVKRYVIWKSQKGFPNAEVLSLYRDYGIILKSSRGDNHNVTSLDTGSYKYVDVGDLVVNKMKAWQGSIAVSNFAGIVSPAYHVFEFYDDNSISRFYLHYLLRCKIYLPEYLRLSTGMRVGQWDLSESDFRNISIVVPPLPEQQAIVAYLDSKCGAIDEVIAKKQQLIAEMENYKKSVIYEYVTGKKEVG